MSLPYALPAIMVCMVAMAVSNTIIRRIAMVPMEKFPLFLTICQNFNYVIVYGSILAFRTERDDDRRNREQDSTVHGRRPVTRAMLRIRKIPFFWIGLCDSLGDLLGNVAVGKLPGYQPPLLAKLNIVFTAFFSRALLGERYGHRQILSMLVVIGGSVVTLLPVVLDALGPANGKADYVDGDVDGEHEQSNPMTHLFYAAVYVSSVAPTALAFVLKEQVFREYESSFDLDIFVVNTYTAIGGVLCQIIFFVPMAALSGVPYAEISGYMSDGYRCFAHDLRAAEASDDSCRGGPLAPVLYLAVNILYNILFLALIKYGGTVLTFVTNTVTFPLSTLLFACGIPWPLLGSSTDMNGWILMGLAVEITGILWYYSEKTKTNIFEVCCRIPSKRTDGSKEETRLLLNDAKQENYGQI